MEGKNRNKHQKNYQFLKDKQPQGWGNIKAVSQYAGVSERTLETWLKEGLKFVRLPSGYRLIKLVWIDEFLESYLQEPGSNSVDQITEKIFKEMGLN
jgi:hypothetical protein